MLGRTVARLAVAIAALTTAVPAQSPNKKYLAGIVSDSLGHPIPYANVTLNGATRAITSDSGTFRLDAPRTGHFTVDVRRIGFRPAFVDFAALPDTTVRIPMEPVIQMLEATEISAQPALASLRAHGFYDRLHQRERGPLVGYFITPEDIEQRHASRASQMLEVIPTLKVHYVRGGPREPFPHYAVYGFDGCQAAVYLNGTRLNTLHDDATSIASIVSHEKSGRALPEPPDFDGLVDPLSLAGIEVYTRGTRAPPEYEGLNGGCAVVLVWTK